MHYVYLFSTFLFLFIQASQGQELYQPRNIKAAYAHETRSKNGAPGKNYWQNHGKYDMDIKVDPQSKLVSGKENIYYTNNSPDTLHKIVIRFVNNLHKPGAIRSSNASKDFLTSGLRIYQLRIGENTYPIDAKSWGTESEIILKQPLLPKSQTMLYIEWEYPLSKESGREGQIDSATFFVAYSYPRISVYDDYNGWDMLPHNGRQEFYNDFNDYAFRVSVPENFVVWATGEFLNPEQVLKPAIVERLRKSYTSDKVIKIATTEEMKNGQVTLTNGWNTWEFSVKNIPDITFAVSNHYQWDASSVMVDSKTNRRASTQAAYSDSAKDFEHSVEWNNYALAWFSINWPGVPYPYSKITAVQGFADMEFPMMVNDTPIPNDFRLARLIQDHEVAHTYFPFYMGINETRYAYMDEGWATTLEYLIGIDEFGKEQADNFYKKFRVSPYITNPSSEEDLPIITMSSQVAGYGYGHNAYGKPSLAYLALKDLLGDKLFKKALHHYMSLWNGKHPIPWDFFNSINTAANQNLNWFWQNWFFSNHYIDLAVTNVNNDSVTLQNIGGFAIPFDIFIEYEDGSHETIHQSPSIWKKDMQKAVVSLKNKKLIKSLGIDGGLFMDATPNNNSWSKK